LGLSDVFSPDGELLWSLDAHFDAAARAAEKGNLNRPVGEQLRHGHVRVGAVGGLYYDRFIGSAAED
jgi:hypothetical protein